MAIRTAAQSIIETLAYFDLFDFPLTQQELGRYLWQPPAVVSFSSLLEALEQLEREAKVQRQWGFWFLPGRGHIIERRRRATVAVEQKLKRARRAARALSGVPFLRAIFVSSSVAAETPRPESDLDFFVIAAPGRIWIVRFWCNLILRLLRSRVYGNKRTNRVCLCFFVDTEHLDLSPWRLAPDDIHFAYWLHQMVPLYDSGNWQEKFRAANAWTKLLLPQIKSPVSGAFLPRLARRGLARAWAAIWEAMWKGAYGDIVEGQMKAIQWHLLKPILKQKSQANTHEVVIVPGVVKLHQRDTRAEVRERWRQKLVSLKVESP